MDSSRCTGSVEDLARAWKVLVFSRSRNRSRSQEWIPNVFTEEPNAMIWLSVKYQVGNVFYSLQSKVQVNVFNQCTLCALSKEDYHFL